MICMTFFDTNLMLRREMNNRDSRLPPPPRMTIEEVLELSGYALSTILRKTYLGEFPRPLFHNRKYGRVYSGEEVYIALGFLKRAPRKKRKKSFRVF